jgi:ribokinase
LETWRAEGIDTGWVLQSAESDTAVAMIYVDSAGHNMIAVAQGANLLRKPEDLDSLAESIAGADMLVCTLGVPLAVAERALILAKRAGTPTLLNPAPAARLTRAMLEAADYITPNESELDILLGSANPSGDDSRADASGMNGNAAGGPADGLVSRARALLCRDDQTLIVTLGAEGARWISRAHTELVPAFRVTAVDTVGAGDCFNAAAAVALAEGKPLTEAVRFANAAAALSVTKRGAVAGMPFRKDCEAFLGI